MSGERAAWVEQRVLLEALLVKARTHVPPAMAERMEIHEYVDRVSRSLVYELLAEVRAQRLADETVTRKHVFVAEHPATTWQMFKQTNADRWWLRWLVRRRPPVMTQQVQEAVLEARWEGWATFPDSSYVPPPSPYLGAPVFMSTVTIK